jgi:hypothetical protein
MRKEVLMHPGNATRQNPLWSLAPLFLFIWLVAALPVGPARAQSARLQLGGLKQLASKAQEVTDVTLDQQMLQLALNFMSKDEEARQLIQHLKGVYIRSYEFSKEGEYSPADVDGILAQLRAAPWQRIVSNRDVKTNKELTVVNIVGPIDLRKLSELEGHFGIPHIKLNRTKEGSGHDQAN